MGRSRQDAEKNNARGNTTRRPRQTRPKGPGTKNGPGSGPPENESPPLKKEDYKGAKKELRHQVKAKVKAKSPDLAKTLVDQAVKGNLHGTEMVLSLMEKKREEGKDGKKKKKKGPNWVQLLVLEQECEEEKAREAKEEEERQLLAAQRQLSDSRS